MQGKGPTHHSADKVWKLGQASTSLWYLSVDLLLTPTLCKLVPHTTRPHRQLSEPASPCMCEAGGAVHLVLQPAWSCATCVPVGVDEDCMAPAHSAKPRPGTAAQILIQPFAGSAAFVQHSSGTLRHCRLSSTSLCLWVMAQGISCCNAPSCRSCLCRCGQRIQTGQR